MLAYASTPRIALGKKVKDDHNMHHKADDLWYTRKQNTIIKIEEPRTCGVLSLDPPKREISLHSPPKQVEIVTQNNLVWRAKDSNETYRLPFPL